jgi:hypothetical protein
VKQDLLCRHENLQIGCSPGSDFYHCHGYVFFLNREWFLTHDFMVWLMYPPDCAVLGRILLFAFAIYLQEYADSAS